MEDDQTGDESSYSVSLPGHTGGRGIPLSDSEKVEALSDSLETQFHPVTESSVPTVIEIVDVALMSYFLILQSEPTLTNPDEVNEAVSGLKIRKAPNPNGIKYEALKHLSQRAVSFRAQIFNAVLCSHQFPQVWKNALEISILKPGKDPALSSFFRPISLLDTIGKLFENILLTRILYK